MSQVYNKMRINVNEQITDIVTAKQNDANSRFLDVYLYDAGKPIDLTGNEVRIYMRKPDKTEIFNNGEITDATAGRCQFELTSQALAAYGVLFAEISIWKDNVEILTTQTFHIFIAESIRDDASIESSNEYGALVVLFQNLYEAWDLMQDMTENFGTPGEVAAENNVTTFWQGIEKMITLFNNQAAANSPIKSIQRGVTTAATTITVDAVNMNKAVVMSVSKSSEGQVRASGYINTSGNITSVMAFTSSTTYYPYRLGGGRPNGNESTNPSNLNYFYGNGSGKDAPMPAVINQSGNMTPSGTTNLTTKQYSARLTSETTLECDGAVEWQLIEYN
jgi:uncharacterized protein (UPF0333 family)